MTEIPPKDADRFRNLLAFLLVGAFVVMVPALMFKAIPGPNKDIITYMVGQLSGMALTALGFYFVNKAGQDALDAKRADNTGKLVDLATSNAGGDGAGKAADDVADAAADKAKEIKSGTGGDDQSRSNG